MYDFLSFLSGLLNGHKNSNFFKIAVDTSDSTKWNQGGFTLKTKPNENICLKYRILMKLFSLNTVTRTFKRNYHEHRMFNMFGTIYIKLQHINNSMWTCFSLSMYQKLVLDSNRRAQLSKQLSQMSKILSISSYGQNLFLAI